MAVDFLEEIYNHSYLLFEMKLLIEDIRSGKSYQIVDKLNSLLPQIGEECTNFVQEQYNEGMELWNCLETLTKYNGDQIFLADFLEDKIIPLYLKYLNSFCSICVDDEDGLKIMSSQSGFLTIQSTVFGVYIHSGIDPMWEAHLNAKEFFQPNKKDYYLYGIGLGYLPYQLYLLSGGSAKLHIYEQQSKMIQYAQEYGVLNWIPDECIDIKISDDISSFLDSFNEFQDGYYIQETSLLFASKEQKEKLKDVIINDKTKRAFDNEYSINYYSNLRNIKKTILDFDQRRLKKDIIIVAAGPSLDNRMEYLKSVQGKKTILAVGTVVSKLVKNGIHPDAITVLDPQERTLKQFDGLWDISAPLFIGVSANRGFAENYQGSKYLVLLDAFEYIPEKYGKVRDMDKVPKLKSTSTVTSLAIELAIYWKAKNIELIGVDFSFPGQVTHAKGTMDYAEKVKESGLFTVEDVNGKVVLTDAIFNCYRIELEETISENKNINFYNLSDIGAKISGTKSIPQELLENL